ncbi:hypothetical protein IBT49_03400 [Erwinia sp. S63]|uniref:hypothetical protein n=1 Tax=Erwinia sp. S63 TaxID=2769341 RepID=UPI00190CE687|nr:hypothetical protein [Erwinia sp. S63]MBK0095008.1 hypothetical protein [Erwinia sp. S63]
MKKPYKSLLSLAIILGTSFSALAGESLEPTGESLTRSVDLIFRAPYKLNFQLTPGKDLKAGNTPDKYSVAAFNVTSTQPYQLGIRFTPGSGEIKYGGLIKLKGKSDPNHIISLGLITDRKYTTLDDWVITKDNINDFSGYIQTVGSQIVPADTYTLSMDASAFIS